MLSIVFSVSINASESKDMTVLPIIAAIQKADEFLGSNDWNAKNNTQENFIKNYLSKRNELKLLSDRELRSCASLDIQVINKFLKDNGFSIKLSPMGGKALAVASIMNILCKWSNPGQPSKVIYQDKEYPAVKMKSGYKIMKFKDSAVLLLGCENADVVCMTQAPKQLEGFGILEFIETLAKEECKEVTADYDKVTFPCVDLNQQSDIKWLVGMIKPDDENLIDFKARIAQAMQQTKFQMDEFGTAVDSAAAMMVARSMPTPKEHYVINEPFLVWINRSGVSVPLSAMYVDPKDWKRPVRS